MKQKVIFTTDQLKEIAGTLETGMKCWYHIPAGEILSAPDSMKNPISDEEIWQDTFDEIDEKIHDCIEFEGLDSREEFGIMESFARNEVADTETRSRLIYALEQRKPFMHFKSAIHYDDKYLEKWYQYKTNCYINHVKEILDNYNRER